IDVTATHPVSLKGYVNTSKGRVTTSVTQSIAFSNFQRINDTSSQFLQNIKQNTSITSNTMTSSRGKNLRTQSQWTYPFDVRYNYVVKSGAATQTTDVLQTKSGSGLDQTRSKASSWSSLNNVHSYDVLNIHGGSASPSNGKSRQQYKSLNVDGACYQETLKSLLYVLTSKLKGC
ncbi:MAG TPA: hypothetical protein VHS56_04445, partial [Candidatus Cybelea sp.]|nr:hypothetical protein [Candidatus Cybelea sp.]